MLSVNCKRFLNIGIVSCLICFRQFQNMLYGKCAFFGIKGRAVVKYWCKFPFVIARKNSLVAVVSVIVSNQAVDYNLIPESLGNTVYL